MNFFALLGCWMALAWGSSGPVIESAEGERVVTIRAADGTARVGTVGSAVEFGDTVKTGPRTSVKVRYPDGSKLLIAPSTEMLVGQGSARSYEYELTRGRVRGLIQKQSENKKQFYFKTKAAVMGVRGTDFVMEAAGAAAKTPTEVHTLKGVVEVAEDMELLESGQGVRIGAGESIGADTSRLGEVQKFDRETYLGQMKSADAGFFALSQGDKEIDAVLSRSEADFKPWMRTVNFSDFQFYLSRVGARIRGGPGDNSDRDYLRPGVSWNPELSFLRWIKARVHFGVMPLEFHPGPEREVVIFELGFLASFTFFRHLVVEAGPGWSGAWHQQTHPGFMVMANVGWRGNFFDLFDRIYIGVASADMRSSRQNASVNLDQIRVGFGF
jgi:hypothetical protein